MDFRSAINEFAQLLSVAANALDRLTKRVGHQERSGEIGEALLETRDIARRLKQISEELDNRFEHRRH